MIRALVLLAMSALAAEASAKMTCRGNQKDSSFVLIIDTPRTATLKVKTPDAETTCELSIARVNDQRRGVSPMVRVSLEQESRCAGADRTLNDRLLRRMFFDVTREDRRAVGFVNAFKLQGFARCELENYSPAELGLPAAD